MPGSELDIGLVVHHAERRDGQGRVMLELARELARRGHRVRIWSHRVDPDVAALVEWHELPRAPGPQPVDDLAVLARATAAVRRARPQVTCVMGGVALPAAPFVYYAQFSHRGWRSTWDEASRPAWKHRVNSALGTVTERVISSRADHVLACSAPTARDLGVPDGRTSVVPNGIDLDEFRVADPATRERCRARLGLPADATVVGFAGEYHTTRKGLQPLIAAVGRGREHLVVAGDGPREAASRWAETAGAGDRVHLVGFADVGDVFPAADLVAVPSRYEPFSIVAVEAAALGLPLLLSARAGAAEHLASGAEIVRDPGDVAELRAGLDRLADPARRRTLGAEGRRRAETLAWPLVAGAAADTVESVARR